MIKSIKKFLAYMRWSKKYVCEMSTDEHDYHDYPDGRDDAGAAHFYEYTCRRCGKKFFI